MLEKNYDAAAIEPRIARRWDDLDAFRAGAASKEGADAFTIVIPPPNVTGSLHMGHALNNTLQDVLVRFERMRGHDVLWQPGMDHAGIATQMVVERHLMEHQEPDRRTMGREQFVERIWQWKEESGGKIFNQLKRLGASCDWSRERFTMDDGLSRAVLKVFVQLYKEGLIYRGKRLVNWDPVFETAISDLEVENKEASGHMWHFKYPLAGGETYEYVERDEDGKEILRETRDYISIATTRPETMLGDGAVAVHPGDERYTPIIGKLCEIPVGPKEHRRLIPIITDEYPDPEFGSGAVKITGAHDFNDYDVATRNDIPLYRLLDEKAALREDGEPYEREATKAQEIIDTGELPSVEDVDRINIVPDEYRGLDRFEARKRIVDDIDAEGLMILIEDKRIMQPFGDRSGAVIEPMLTDQWYVDAETLAKPAIESVRDGRTVFVPKNWEKTYFDWMENIQPWCISRQLWWGHQIPAWYGPDGTVFVEEDEEAALSAAIQHYIASEGPWKAWVEDRLENFKPGELLTRDEDVLDTWFSSGLWPFSTLGWPDETPELAKYYPTSVLVTGFDIIFFWVARMMMMGLHFTGKEPFHTVYVHALVRDKQGAKMSKSKGNVIDPLELIDEYGADALRFTLAIMAAQGRDVKLDTARVAGYRNFGTKLWNAARFSQMNGVGSSTDFDASECKLTVNRWILTELSRTAASVTGALEAYRFNEAADAAYRFVWHTFCDWYVELLKPVFSSDNAAHVEEARACAGHVLDEICKLLHPFMPFITEELWDAMSADGRGRDGLLCHASWPGSDFDDREAADEINWLVELITEIRSVRSEMNIKTSILMSLVFVGGDETTRTRMAVHAPAIQQLGRIGSIEIATEVPKGSAQIVMGEATACLPLEGIIDFAGESSRLQGEIKKLNGEVKRLEGKLGNEKFVANAPDDVVASEREKLADYKEKRERTEAALARISG